MYLIVGLGNPGDKYTFTRHNAGFLAIEQIAKRHSISLSSTGHNAVFGKGRICGKEVILAQPQTFMNASGLAVKQLMNYFKISLDELVVIYDDMDIDVGSLRIRLNGSAGTHNGMKSIIIDHLKTENFKRIRVGIGRPAHHNIIDFVLSNFGEDEMPLLADSLKNAADAIDVMMSRGTDVAMNQFNKKKKPQKQADEQDKQ